VRRVVWHENRLFASLPGGVLVRKAYEAGVKAANRRQSLRGVARPRDWRGASAPPQGVNS